MFNMDTGKWLPALPLFGSLVCVYCGGPADTSDHTPPLCLLPKPWPGNVQAMTVPACSKCNGEFSQDEMRTAAAQAVCLCANAALSAALPGLPAIRPEQSENLAAARSPDACFQHENRLGPKLLAVELSEC
jgi:hypothetical protein